LITAQKMKGLGQSSRLKKCLRVRPAPSLFSQQVVAYLAKMGYNLREVN
jgi:hypothetical protein